MHVLSPELAELLKTVDTPTLCNALIAVDPALRARGYTTGSVVCADPSLPPMTGFACTARINSSEPADAPPDAMRQRRFDYYRYIAEGPNPRIVVMQDIGGTRGLGCLWGGVNASIHKSLGVAGAVTDGAIRDLGTLPSGFQLLGGNVCPGSAYAHLVEFDVPVSVFGLDVTPGDLIHADHHGAVSIPVSALPKLPAAIDMVLRRETEFLAALASGGGYESLIQAWRIMEKSH